MKTILIVAAFSLGFLVGGFMREDRMKAIAVKLGHAEWMSDADGDPVFRWKEIDEAQPMDEDSDQPTMKTESTL
jgi:hypothetical protein